MLRTPEDSNVFDSIASALQSQSDILNINNFYELCNKHLNKQKIEECVKLLNEKESTLREFRDNLLKVSKFLPSSFVLRVIDFFSSTFYSVIERKRK
jgi:chromosome condensin MukBEF complex kleisin-like MukF subunit